MSRPRYSIIAGQLYSSMSSAYEIALRTDGSEYASTVKTVYSLKDMTKFGYIMM